MPGLVETIVDTTAATFVEDDVAGLGTSLEEFVVASLSRLDTRPEGESWAGALGVVSGALDAGDGEG